jgi:hypothetical protein
MLVTFGVVCANLAEHTGRERIDVMKDAIAEADLLLKTAEPEQTGCFVNQIITLLMDALVEGGL